MSSRTWAATSGSGALHIAQGSGADRENGDYVSAADALDAPHSFYVEVPPGLARLDIDIFDADVGMGGNSEGTRDRQRNGSWNTATRYRVFDPRGQEQDTRFTTGSRNGPSGADNAWLNLYSAGGTILPGHWEVRVDASSAVTSGNDVNGFGVRAHDGSANGGGRELNVYLPSFTSYGANLSDATSVYTHHPYVTAGCALRVSDFDFDFEQNPTSASIELASPDGAFHAAVDAPSANDTWLETALEGWAGSAASSGYGAWTMTARISGPAGAGNYANAYLSGPDAAAAPPSSQPERDTFRIYLPRDAGGAPPLPTLEQSAVHVSGPNPPTPGQASRFRVRLRALNPAAGAIDVARVDVAVPTSAVYRGNAAASHGTLTSQPAEGQAGALAWKIGSLPAGAIAALAYEVEVTPRAAGETVRLTGTPDDGGTTATIVDATCAGASPGCSGAQLARATLAFGPLCEIAVVAGATAPTETPNPMATETPAATPSPTLPAAPPATATAAPPTATETAAPSATFTPAPPTATDTTAPTATFTPPPTNTWTVPPTETSTPTVTAEPTPIATAIEPTAGVEEPRCGDGHVDAGEECDDGDANRDDVPDACRTTCILPRCGDGVPDTPSVDLVVVIETSLSMRNDLKRLVTTLGPLPEQFAAAGVDYRIAVVRYGTGKLRRGPDAPEILLDFTDDGPAYRAQIDTLRSKLTGPTESGTEALGLALDHLAFRPSAIPVFLLFTDEDDDLPVTVERGGKREPPASTWGRSSRTALFQQRIDEVAQRLVDAGARMVMLVNPRQKPTEQQYGCPRATMVGADGRLDVAATLAALADLGAERSLQGQLLAAGLCRAGRCSGGKIGFPCAVDDDCGLPARAYPITMARDASLEAFFQALREELIQFGSCAP